MKSHLPPSTVPDLLQRYERGDRDFRGAVLRGDTFAGYDLRGADLGEAVLGSACLDEADLRGANLTGANLNEASLRGTRLGGANLTRASLIRVILEAADLQGAVFNEASIGSTILIDTDISGLVDAVPPVTHMGASAVDFRCIIRSVRALNLRHFLLKTGMPEVFAEYDVSCAQSMSFNIMKRFLQSTFISYGAPDEGFARKLYEVLHKNGVTTFFFAEHAVPGQKLHRMMRDGINAHDRMILVCSRASLNRTGVQNEIEEILAREAREGGEALLIPVRVDDYVLHDWKPKNAGIAQAVRDRVVADFRGSDRDPTVFEGGVLRLLAALKR
jgi:uncharacterized protein YjbI with pentapeptide repeats